MILNDLPVIRRKRKLKSQALHLIRNERDELRHLENLIRFRGYLQKRIKQEFDPSLSQQLDAVQYLIESLSPQMIISGETNEPNAN